MSLDVQTIELPCGLRVTTLALAHLHTATLAAFVKVGSRFESPEDNGLSHFVEHMLFRGTDAYPSSRELSVAFESLGGSLSGETGRDLSVYHVSLEPEFIDRGLALMAEFIGRPVFADIELERAIILEEMIADYDQDGIEVNGDDIVRGLLFGTHPLGQRIIGPVENVRRFDVDDVRRHYAKHYNTKNIHLCVAGPIDRDAITGCTQMHFGQISSYPPPLTCRAPRFEQSEAVYEYVPDSVSQTSIHLLFRSIPDMEPSFLAVAALCRALDDGMSTPLHYELCDRRGLAYELDASIEPLADVSLFEITGASSQANIPALIRGVFEVLDRFREQPVTDAELARIKRRYRFELASALDDSFAMATLAGGASLYYPPRSMEQRLTAMNAISAEDIRHAARVVFRPERLAAAVVGPLSPARQGEVRELIREWR